MNLALFAGSKNHTFFDEGIYAIGRLLRLATSSA